MARTHGEPPVSDRPGLLYIIMQATFVVRAALIETLQHKAGFRPDQPRVPAGNPEGGQWVDEDGDADLVLVDGDPNEFPDAPEKRPSTTKERNAWSRRPRPVSICHKRRCAGRTHTSMDLGACARKNCGVPSPSPIS